MAEAIHVAGDGRALALTVIFGLPAVLAAMWLPIHLSRTPFADYLALRWTSWQNLVIGIVAMVVRGGGWDLLSRATGHEVTAGFMGDIVQSATADGVLWLAVLAFAVVAPLTEELLARGFLYRGWSESFLRVPGAIVLSSLVWTAMHVQYDLFLPRRGFFDRSCARLHPLPQPIDLADDAAARPQQSGRVGADRSG